MDRRTFIGALVAVYGCGQKEEPKKAAEAPKSAPLALAGQSAQGVEKVPRVALVFNNLPVAELTAHRFDRAFVAGLRDLGLVEGRNIMIERRSAEGRYERFPSLMQGLLALQVDVIVATGPAVWAAKRATDTIPIVAVATDSLDSGATLATSLALPGRNLTGLSSEVDVEVMNRKRLQLLAEAAPKASRVAFLGQRSRPSDDRWHSAIEAAAHALRLTLFWAGADTPEELQAAFAAIAQGRADALFVDGTAVNYVHTRQISEFAARQRLPAIYPVREGPEAGGLMSYGSNLTDQFRRAATFVDKILRGAKPAELPIEQPTKFELVINLSAAKALGLTIPQPLLLRADDVIQ
jgi:putative ABC transport system substrate-binding protein